MTEEPLISMTTPKTWALGVGGTHFDGFVLKPIRAKRRRKASKKSWEMELPSESAPGAAAKKSSK